MNFDLVVGNPPYQQRDGGNGASAVPIYNHFVELAKSLSPRIIALIIPSRWMFGGRGLSKFRHEMLGDTRIRTLIDIPDSRRVFKNVDVAGGVCAFLWDSNYAGHCRVVENAKSKFEKVSNRPLLENGAEVFVRNSVTLGILKKMIAVERKGEAETDLLTLPDEQCFARHVSAQRPFGLRTSFRGNATKSTASELKVIQAKGAGWVERAAVKKGKELIDQWKIYTSKSSAEHAGQANKNGQRRVLSRTEILPPGSVVTETYVVLGTFNTEKEALNCLSYVTSRFFRYLVVARASAQDLSRSAYQFVPEQDWSQEWSDHELYKKYGLAQDEIDHVESTIGLWRDV